MALGGGHKICLVLSMLGALILIAGSAAPYWQTTQLMSKKVHLGLWFYCTENGGCELYPWEELLHSEFEDEQVWFYVVHVMAGLATLFAVIALFTSLGNLCCKKSESTRKAGCVTLFTALLGITTTVLFYNDQEVSTVGQTFNQYDRFPAAAVVFSSGSGLLALIGIALVVLPRAPSNAVDPV